MGHNAMFVLVHSPLLRSSSWRWVARELVDRGRSAVALRLLPADATWSTWREVCGAVNAASPHRDALVLVGHSGAGTLLPAIGEPFEGEVAGSVFVDAVLPPSRGAAGLVPAEFIEGLHAVASAVGVAPWSDVVRPGRDARPRAG